MKRRFIAATVLIGILLVGVLTTVMMRSFVSSQAEKVTAVSVSAESDKDTPDNIILSRNETNTEIPSVRPRSESDGTDEEGNLSGSDADEDSETVTPDGSVAPEISETVVASGAAAGSAASGTAPVQNTDISDTHETSPAGTEQTVSVIPSDNSISPAGTDESQSVVTAADSDISVFSVNDIRIDELGSQGPGDYVSITPLDTTAADTGDYDADDETNSPGNGNVTTVGEAAGPAETVKSPLEVPETVTDVSDFLSREELYARLEDVEEKTASSVISPQAAEYELNLWDYEMNLIADTLISVMNYDDAEALKQDQLVFLKERDLSYDSGALANRAQAETDTSYITEATEKTRKRCYDLLEIYGDLLD